MAKITIQDVARTAQVSIKTVSRVLNNEANVKEETRERVQQAINLLSYRPNPSARRLASRRSFLIGLLYDNPSTSYVINNQIGVLEQCQTHNYDLLIHPCDYRDEQLVEDVLGFIRQTRLDGVILTPPLSDLDSLVQALSESEVRFICIGRGHPGPCLARVITNDEEAARRLTAYLIELGHRDIAFIKGHPDHRSVQFREAGFRRALQEAGIPVDEDRLVQGYNSFESGLNCGHVLLGSHPPPTAIFAANDDMASGVIKAAYELGIDIPHDLSVVGFDDVPLAAQLSPGLTTVRQPIRNMAELAAEKLMEHISGDLVDHSLFCLESELILRESASGPAYH